VIPLLSLGACANLVLLEIAGDIGVPGVIFLPPLFLCLIGIAAAAGVARRERLDGD
jgi:hypothetical protein